MTGRVDEVEQELVADVAERPVGHADRLGLDGDAPLALDVHAVEVLVAHLAGVDEAGHLEHAVGQGGLPVVHVGHDAEVPDALLRVSHGGRGPSGWSGRAERDAPQGRARTREGA